MASSMKAISRLLCTTLIVLTFSNYAFAFPASPLPMYELWRRSELVVFADVVSAKTENGKQYSIISVAKFLKGDKAKASASLSIFTQLGGCPYPHHFKVNERVIVFLRYDSDELMYTPVGMAESAIVTDAESLKAYQAAFDELPKIFEVRDEPTRNAQLLRWSVKCTVNSSTRSEGLTALSCLRPKNAKIGEWLLPQEANRLLDVIFAEASPDQVLGIIDLMSEFPNQQLDELLTTSLVKCHEQGWSKTARHALQVLPGRIQATLSATLDQQLDNFWKLESEFYYGDGKKSTKRKRALKTSLDTKFGWVCAQVWSEITEKTLRTER